jgi:hypothetical protein
MNTKTVKRNLRKCLSCIVAAVTLMATVGCGPIDNGEKPLSPEEGYELWSAPATEKILQNTGDYSAVKTAPKITIDSSRNEYENAQILITAKGKVDEYEVELSDLTMDGGEEVYDKANISVYNMKYTNVSAPWTPNAVIGWYPDAILPFDAAVKAGENTVSAGNNQSIWFSFKTPADQAVGTYTGTVKIKVDGEVNTIPVSVRVRNLNVTDTVHNKCMFINAWSYYLGEYGDTQELVDAYNKLLFEYRVAPTSLVIDRDTTNEYYEYFADKAYELAGNDGASTLSLSCSKTASGIPKGQLSSYIRELAKKSCETGYNLLKKAYVYGIDEPISNNALDKTKAFAESFRSQIADIVEELTAQKQAYIDEYGVSEEYFDEVLNAAANVRFVTTTRFREDYEPYVDIWCPHFNSFESGYATGLYDGEDKLWWYGAVSPKAPYPTYHLDDTLLSSRMVGWLQSIYNVEGNIYWGVNVYAKYNGSYQYVDDYYTDPGHYYNVNGDGFLLYPGKKYGIDGPIPSIRLESIRDGYEEYEMLYAINEKYAEIGLTSVGKEFSATETVADIASSLYTGMKITATNESFATARSSLLDLAEFTESGICFTDYTDDGEGLIEYELFVPNGASLNVTGATKTKETAVNGGKMIVYSADMKLENASSKVRFETQVNGETVAVERDLIGKVWIYNAETLQNSFSGMIAGESTIVDGEPITGLSGSLYKLSLAAAEPTSKQEVKLVNDAVASKLNAESDKALFTFWYDGEDTISLETLVKYKNQRYKVSISTLAIRHGWNTVEWKNLASVNWEKNGNVEYVLFSVGNNGDAARSNLYFKNVVVYEAKGDERDEK